MNFFFLLMKVKLSLKTFDAAFHREIHSNHAAMAGRRVCGKCRARSTEPQPPLRGSVGGGVERSAGTLKS